MRVVRIGRSSNNDIIIEDPIASRMHCQIIEKDGIYTLIDTQSTNGTIVNGVKRHGEIRLCSSDIVKIGNTTLPWTTYFKIESQSINNTPFQNVVPDRPNNFLVWAILATIFCCIPFGIVSIVHAAKVDRLWEAGDYVGAEKASRNAKIWFWWSFAIGLVFGIIYTIYYSIVFVAMGATTYIY